MKWTVVAEQLARENANEKRSECNQTYFVRGGVCVHFSTRTKLQERGRGIGGNVGKQIET